MKKPSTALQYRPLTPIPTSIPAIIGEYLCDRPAGAPIWHLPIDVIRLDGGTQARVAVSTLTVDAYAQAMQAGATFLPVVVFREGETYWLGDGFHRVYAAQQAGMSTIAAEIHPGTRRDAVLYAVGANATHGLRRSNADKRRAVLLLLDDDVWSRWSDREIARRCHVSHDFVSRMRQAICHPMTDDPVRYAERQGKAYVMRTGRIGKRAAPVFDAVANLSVEVRALLRETVIADDSTILQQLAAIADAAKQAQVAEMLLAGDAQNVREALRHLAYADKQAVTLREVVQGQFPVIYADPPWQYSNARLAGAAASHYPTMSTQALCALPIPEFVTSNAVLFLWATNPMLPDALQVMAAWGFRYCTNLAWVKDKPTYGKLAFYVRGQHELLLIGVKGSCLPKAGMQPVSVLTAAKGRHSEKPEDVYDLIEGMYAGPYLELFARCTHPGWTSFGNEVRERSACYDATVALTTPCRILLVEDNPDMQELFTLVLTVAGCVLTVVGTVTEAWQVLQHGAWDVLLTDHQLPDGTGAALIAQAHAAGIPVATVLMSATLEVVSLATDCQADGHFWKGDDLSRLVTLITSLGTSIEA